MFRAAQRDVLPVLEGQEEALLARIVAANAQQVMMFAALGLD